MNDQYIVSARKYRPATFGSVVGQKHLTTTLRNAISSERLAQAYLFCGPRGVGKTSCARIFAKTINCLHRTPEGEACGECESCRAFEAGNSYNIVELDAASNNGVDDIRAITEQVAIPPQVGRYRVFIIDEVHMLSTAAFNAFLKTLEEPPSYAVFILATTEKHKVIPTILSRCQIYDFKRITIDDTIDHLAYVAANEGIEADRKALGIIARKADGAMRDALSIFDQLSASTEGKLTYDAVVENLNVLDYDFFFRLVDAFAAMDVPQALLLYKEVRDRGFDSLFFVGSLAQHIRDLMVAADPSTRSLLDVPQDVAERLTEQARTLPLKWYYAAMGLLNDCDMNYRTAGNKQFLVELTLIRLCQLLDPNPGEIGRAVRPRPLRDLKPAPEGPAPAQTTAPSTSGNSEPSSSEKSVPQKPGAEVAPTRVSRPAPTPRPAPPSESAPRAAAPAARPGMFRLKEQTPAEAPREEQLRDFTDEEFIRAWNEFIASHPDMHILTTAMRNATPKRVGPEEFHVLVEHPGALQAFESAMQPLMESIRGRLGNDRIRLNVAINPNSEVARQLPPREFLKKIIEENPVMGMILRDLDAEVN
ncbi:MAG: DNA polymerase III subunit gamma/tau [Bacteroidales bacterium]|nr:DNA polymerase III subunit gamma/tau [Bacteroidales bacterium]